MANFTKKIEIDKIISGNIKTTLKPNDRIIFFRNTDFKPPKKIHLTGAVKLEGVYPIPSSGLSLDLVIKRAGGLESNALQNGIHIFRDSLRLGWQKNSMLILPGDSISVLYDQKTIEILGEVNAPGIYEIENTAVSVQTALAMAGGISSQGSNKRIFIMFPNGMVRANRRFFPPKMVSGSTLVVNKKAPDEYRTALETTEKLAGIVGSLATLLLVINSTTAK